MRVYVLLLAYFGLKFSIQ